VIYSILKNKLLIEKNSAPDIVAFNLKIKDKYFSKKLPSIIIVMKKKIIILKDTQKLALLAFLALLY
jgi:hypothetical protein